MSGQVFTEFVSFFSSLFCSNGVKDCADNSDELTEKCLTNNEEKLRGKCSAEQFQCNSGECIPIDNLCKKKWKNETTFESKTINSNE